MSEIRPVTDDEAREILSRFIASHFDKHDREHARFRIPADPAHDDDLRLSQYITETESLRLALAEATRDRDEALRTVKALTPAANYCLEYKPLLLKAERERDEAIRVLRDIATFGWYAKGAKVARAYLAAREGR